MFGTLEGAGEEGLGRYPEEKALSVDTPPIFHFRVQISHNVRELVDR